jgi:hypothetical protein
VIPREFSWPLISNREAHEAWLNIYRAFSRAASAICAAPSGSAAHLKKLWRVEVYASREVAAWFD